MNTSLAMCSWMFFHWHMMLMILGLLAVLLVPLPSLTKGKKLRDLCFLRFKYLNMRDKSKKDRCFHVTHAQTKSRNTTLYCTRKKEPLEEKDQYNVCTIINNSSVTFVLQDEDVLLFFNNTKICACSKISNLCGTFHAKRRRRKLQLCCM